MELLCLDELGYVKLDSTGSELLFEILTEREGEGVGHGRLQPPVFESAQVPANMCKAAPEAHMFR